MRTAVADIVSDVRANRRTGLLSFTLVGSNSLFKVFFSEGDIYHLACGTLKGPECLASIDTFEFTGHSFISNIRLDINGGLIPPTDEIIHFLKAIGKAVRSDDGEPEGALSSRNFTADESGRVRSALKMALIRQIGPAGERVFTKLVQRRWETSPPSTREEFLELVNLLKAEIDDGNDREQFLGEVRSLLP